MLHPGTIQWRPQIDPLLCGLLLLGAAAWLYAAYRRMLQRHTRSKTLLLLSPKLAVATLLLLALFDPVWTVERPSTLRGSVLALIDTSSSMDTPDDGRQPRLARARSLLDMLDRVLTGTTTLDPREFDIAVRKAGAAPSTNALRGTDLGAALAAVAPAADADACLGVLLLTDGGDEPVQTTSLPAAPLTVIGIGSNPDRWNDLAITDVKAPAVVEQHGRFEIAVDLMARGMTQNLNAVRVNLERFQTGSWTQCDYRTVNLQNGRAHTTFFAIAEETGIARYRLNMPAFPGELSSLNNTRIATVDVQRKAVNVLFFTRELGMEYKLLRSELARDPGLAFTALFRTMGERFTVQSDRMADTESLEAGLPTSATDLKAYDCIIVGSFPASDWKPEQMAALVAYVEGGGSVVFLGGDKSFGLGGYAATPLAALFPWRIAAAEQPLLRGIFPLALAPAASGDPILAGIEDGLGIQAATISSANQPGPLKPGARALLEANIGGQAIPLMALHTVGKGKVLGIASNTLWELARRNAALRDLYGRLWRQAVRNITGSAEGGQILAVRWDKDHYRPGDHATASIRITSPTGAKDIRLAASLTVNEATSPLSVEHTSDKDHEDSASLSIRFPERGEYTVRATAYQGDRVVETYEKLLQVAPMLSEGSKLELDDIVMRELAMRGSGTFVPEADAADFIASFAARFPRRREMVELPLAQTGPYFFVLVLSLLIIEWWLRRKAQML